VVSAFIAGSGHFFNNDKGSLLIFLKAFAAFSYVFFNLLEINSHKKINIMEKYAVVNSRNLTKTLLYKIILTLLVLFFLFLFALSSNWFGEGSALETFFFKNESSVMTPISIGIVIIAVILSVVTRSRMRNPIPLGTLELDEQGYTFTGMDNGQTRGTWNNARYVVLEFFSVAKMNNPKGCLNYLTIVDNLGTHTYEILIESSLAKSGLGDQLRQINTKVPVKVKYAQLIKQIFRDKDLSLR